MKPRTASCSCGQLTATTQAEPIRGSVCHCLACQRRTGSVFAAQAKALEEGMWYQTPIASVLHRFVTGKPAKKESSSSSDIRRQPVVQPAGLQPPVAKVEESAYGKFG